MASPVGKGQTLPIGDFSAAAGLPPMAVMRRARGHFQVVPGAVIRSQLATLVFLGS